MLEPDRDMLEIFVDALFRRADDRGFVAVRSFYEGADKPFRLSTVNLSGGLRFLIEVAEDDARRAAQSPAPAVFCPPVATFNTKDHAREQDLREGLALSVELDQHPQHARATLENLLGPATVVVRSGGRWANGGQPEDKLHLHWRLKVPANGKAALAALKQARDLAARLVGGDPSNKPVCHPIRWPGSWHRKAEPRLCEIEQVDADVEIELETALGRLQAVSPPEPEAKSNGCSGSSDSSEWFALVNGVITGTSYHAPLVALAARLVGSGMHDGTTVKLLRAIMSASTAPHDAMRWQRRFDAIPRIVSSAREKYAITGDDKAPAPVPPEPVDLWGHFEPPTLPCGLLPDTIEKYAFAQAETMGVDPGGVAMAALAVCAAAIPDRIKLVMKQYSTEWTETARLWVGLVGQPSTKKSPIISAVIRPLVRLDANLLRDFLFELERWEQLDKDERKKASKPVQKRLRLEDTTIEAAQDVLAGSPDGLLLVQDELSGFFGAMDKYGGQRGAAKDRGFWLQAYNGGQYALNRVNRGVGLIPNLSVSLLGGIQPDVIRRLASESYDDGFLQRMLLVVLRAAEVGKDVATPHVSTDYAWLIERLPKLQLPVSASLNDDHDGILRFDNRAQAFRGRLEAEYHDLMQVEAINRKMAAHIGKYDGLFGRLCVAFHCIEHAYKSYIPEFVTEGTAERVAEFMRRFLLPHALAFYSGVLKLADDHDRLAAVAGYILARQSERITNRDVQRGDATMRKLTRHDTESTFEQLEALGWVTRMAGPRLTDPPHWLVNPAVHQRFAARAAEERTRREAVVSRIKGLS
jgi:hypothetical protein